MATYRVIWEIDIDADSPREAAQEADRIQRAPCRNWSSVYQVVDPSGATTQVDVDEQDEEAGR